MSIFWDQALSLMEEQKFRQADVARALGVSRTTVFNWISRDTLPQVDNALKIADFLGVSVRYLVTGLDEEQLPADIREIVKLCYAMDPDDRQTAYRMLQQFVKGMVRKEKREASPGSSDSVARS